LKKILVALFRPGHSSSAAWGRGAKAAEEELAPQKTKEVLVMKKAARLSERKKEKIYSMSAEEQILHFEALREEMTLVRGEILKKRQYRAGCQADVVNFFKLVSPIDKEAVNVLFLDAKNKIIMHKEMSVGTVSQSVLYPREIIKTALAVGALGLIVIHNHPSFDPAPSENDRKITRKLLFACKEMDLNVLDHIIVGGNDYYSFYEQGLMSQYSNEHADIAGRF
jgi:DNA repair protein RadC